jgi:hypothetical protein
MFIFPVPRAHPPRQHPAMIRGVNKLKAAAKPQTTFLCLSNANSVFISTILQVRDGPSSSGSLPE